MCRLFLSHQLRDFYLTGHMFHEQQTNGGQLFIYVRSSCFSAVFRTTQKRSVRMVFSETQTLIFIHSEHHIYAIIAIPGIPWPDM